MSSNKGRANIISKRKHKNRGRQADLCQVFNVEYTGKRIYIDCSLNGYLERDRDFISKLCSCETEFCNHLHNGDFDELADVVVQ